MRLTSSNEKAAVCSRKFSRPWISSICCWSSDISFWTSSASSIFPARSRKESSRSSVARRLTSRDWLSTYSSVTSSLVTARDSTSRASASTRTKASSSDWAGTRTEMLPLCLDDRSELTTQPPSPLATLAMLSTVWATSSTTSDMRAVWTMMRFWAKGAGRTLPPTPPSASCAPAAGVGAGAAVAAGSGAGVDRGLPAACPNSH